MKILKVVACLDRKPQVQVMTADHKRVATLNVKDYDEAVKLAHQFAGAPALNIASQEFADLYCRYYPLMSESSRNSALGIALAKLHACLVDSMPPAHEEI